MSMTTEIIKLVTAIIVLVTVLVKLFGDWSKDKKSTTATPVATTPAAATPPRWALWWGWFVYVSSSLTILSFLFGPAVPATTKDVAVLISAFVLYYFSDKYLDALKHPHNI